MTEQVVSELSPEQLAEFEQTGNLELSRTALGPTSQILVSDFTARTAEMIQGTGGDLAYFVDPSNTAAMGVELRRTSTSILSLNCIGRSPSGVRVVFP